jgi:hypothetical protein
MHLLSYQGWVYEERHPDGVSVTTQPMSGTIVAMRWRPKIVREEAHPDGFIVRTVLGYEAGTPIPSTEFEEPLCDWVFEFDVDTDDPVPETSTEIFSGRRNGE